MHDDDLDPKAASCRADPPGYARLKGVDASERGRLTGGFTVLVPSDLARPINDARENLIWRPSDGPLWRQAVVPRQEEPPSATSAPATAVPPAPVPGPSVLNPRDRLGTGVSTRPKSKPSAATRLPPLDLAGRPETGLPDALMGGGRGRSPARIRGSRIRVLDPQELVRRRAAVNVGHKGGVTERRLQDQLLDDLEARGPWRSVALPKDWQPRLQRLDEEMPHFGAVIERIRTCCTLALATRRPLRIPPLLLAGSPGVGKTRFALRLAEVLGVAHFVYALESAESTSVLTGSEKHWSCSEPGALFRLIVQGTQANPLVLLDELDKASRGLVYRPLQALHAVLEPMTARQLRDKSADLAFDASWVVYLATTNRLSGLDASLLSRFVLCHIKPPDARAAVAIARSVCREVLAPLTLSEPFESPTGEVLQQLALLGVPRLMHQVLSGALGRALVAGRRGLVLEDLEMGLGAETPRPTEWKH